jgi:hypothetical protein
MDRFGRVFQPETAASSGKFRHASTGAVEKPVENLARKAAVREREFQVARKREGIRFAAVASASATCR